MAGVKKRKIRVAILMGGPSSEHEVSLRTAANVARALDKTKYETKKVLIDRLGNWEISPEELKQHVDVAFIAMHGTYGEDGTVQSILEANEIPYTGSDAMTSALAMNKFVSLRTLRHHGVPTPISHLVSKQDWEKNPFHTFEWIRYYTGYPLVAKPNKNGSSVAVYIAKNKGELIRAFNHIFSLEREALLQNYVRGKEVTCGVLDHGWPESAFALLPTEIVPRKNEFFDYEEKYSPTGAYEITPPRLPKSFIEVIQKTALQSHKALRARGFSRTDMILDASGMPYVLEVNTIPGLTERSLIPKATEVSGIPFPQLLDHIVSSALRRKIQYPYVLTRPTPTFRV